MSWSSKVEFFSSFRKEYIFCSDAFVNSQEWTLSRSVLDIRIGLLGTLSSGKSAFVHRYLTGTYMQEESPEGGRFKKETQIDNQSYLLLIRDEANAPDTQVGRRRITTPTTNVEFNLAFSLLIGLMR